MTDAKKNQFRMGEGRISGYLSVLFGTISLLTVVCFLFPEYLTTPDLRSSYPIDLFRTILFYIILFSYCFAFITFFLGKNKRKGMIGILLSTAALIIGGWQVELKEYDTAFIYIGVDWAILDLLILAIIFIPLEKLNPLIKEQVILRDEWKTDFVYFIIGHFLFQIIAIVVITPSSILYKFLNILSVQINVDTWPFVLQLILALFLTDLFQATMHRFFHLNSFLWRFHSIHHSIKSLDWLAGSRLHLFDIFLTRSFGFIPLYIIGFSENIVTSYAVIVAFQTVLAHSNTKINFGFFKYLFVTPQYHHWHHSGDAETYNKNYAVHFPVIDIILRSYYLPGDTYPSRYGIDESVPNSYIKQFIYPFKKSDTKI